MNTIKVITTVGASLIQNANNLNKGGEGVTYYDDLSVLTYERGKADSNQKKINKAKTSIRTFINKKNNISVSAEIKSLVLIQKEQNCKLEVYLICTDTTFSVLAADMIKEFFEGKDGQGGYDPNKEKFVINFDYNEEFIMKNDSPRFISYDCDVFNVTAGDRQWAVQCAIKNSKNTICLSERQLTQFVSNSTNYYSSGCWDGWYDWS